MSVQSSRSVIYQESGIALLGSVLVAALVLGLAGWGILNMTKVAQQSVYGESAANQARTAALIGIQAVTGYAQSEYLGSNPSTASLSYLQTAGLQAGDGPVNELFTKPTNSSVQSMITANTFSTSNGYIKMLSTGRSGSAIQTAEAYITAQLSSLNTDDANFILGKSSTFDGKVHNDTDQIIVASTAANQASSGITFHGTKITYKQISSFPVINPQAFAQYATIKLNSNGTITVPSSADAFYYSYLSSLTATSSNSYFSYDSGTNTWTINKPINALIYTPDNIILNLNGSTAQLTIVAGGTITVSSDVTLNPFAYYISSSPNANLSGTPATVTATTSSTSPGSVCGDYSSLPVCEGTVPYAYLQGLVLLSAGNLSVDSGVKVHFNGDIATAGTLYLNGAGSDSFGGTIIARNGLGSGGSTIVHGSITLTKPVSGTSTVTLGGYQLTPSSIRWVP